MRLAFAFVAAGLLAGLAPAGAQQLSPLTGTTAGPGPAASPPGTTMAPAETPPAPARPARPPRQTFKQRFDAANTTHDGKLTLEQAKAGRLPRIAANFDAIDTGRKGYVTLADIQAYNRAQRQARSKPQ